MKYLKNILPVFGALVILCTAGTGDTLAFSFGPPNELTGASGEGNCTQCHTGNQINADGGSLEITVPNTYKPNEVYTIVVNLARAGQNRWGFEMTALDATGTQAGTFVADAAANTKVEETNSKQYIKQTALGGAQGTNDAHSWKFQWTAPGSDIGPITFYAAGNAANGDFQTTGDYIYTEQAESTPPVPVVAGVTLEIVGNAALTIRDALAGAGYTLKITNTGNMTDTVTLETSAEVGIEGTVLGALSQRAVSLEAGASAEMTLTVTGDALTLPGDYAITVTATSGNDNTMTAQAATTTTIAPPPPPWDVNADGIINIQDLVLVASEFGQAGESLKGDINGDNTVNILDLVMVASHFGETIAN